MLLLPWKSEFKPIAGDRARVCDRSLAGIAGSNLPSPVAERSKERVCGRSLAETAGSNPAGGIDVCVVSVTQ